MYLRGHFHLYCRNLVVLKIALSDSHLLVFIPCVKPYFLMFVTSNKRIGKIEGTLLLTLDYKTV